MGKELKIPLEIKPNTSYTDSSLTRLNQSLAGLVKGLDIVLERTICAKSYVFFIAMKRFLKGLKNKDYLDVLVTNLAELRLSELGYRFVPGVYPVFRRIKCFIEAKACIVKAERS